MIIIIENGLGNKNVYISLCANDILPHSAIGK